MKKILVLISLLLNFTLNAEVKIKPQTEALAFKTRDEKSKAWKKTIVTEVTAAQKFWPAENYHQKYLMKNPGGYDNHYLRNISFDRPSK